jgi:hypothetical protein
MNDSIEEVKVNGSLHDLHVSVIEVEINRDVTVTTRRHTALNICWSVASKNCERKDETRRVLREWRQCANISKTGRTLRYHQGDERKQAKRNQMRA